MTFISFYFRYKSRADKINEIICRSEARAQQLLTSGSYTLPGSISYHSILPPAVDTSRIVDYLSPIPTALPLHLNTEFDATNVYAKEGDNEGGAKLNVNVTPPIMTSSPHKSDDTAPKGQATEAKDGAVV